MKVRNWKDVPGAAMGEQAPGVTKRVLIGVQEGAGNFVMRLFTVAPGARTPFHKHDWEHEVFVLEGKGTLVGEEGGQPLKPGDTTYVPPGVVHQFRNAGSQDYRMLCLVPMKGA